MSQGKMITEWQEIDNPPNPKFRCPNCGTRVGLRFRDWESDDGAYTDRCYDCTECKYVWWIEGPDA
jgi:ssDNA-binding Zn-finger/Zn-ribbon topoisomerase 1